MNHRPTRHIKYKKIDFAPYNNLISFKKTLFGVQAATDTTKMFLLALNGVSE